MPKALKSCPKCKKSPNLVTLDRKLLIKSEMFSIMHHLLTTYFLCKVNSSRALTGILNKIGSNYNIKGGIGL